MTIITKRRLPISPKHREFTIEVEGEILPRVYNLLAASIISNANKIPHARLVFSDGDAAKEVFSIFDDQVLDFGKSLQIRAGDSDAQTLLFSGIIVEQEIKIREEKSPQLIIVCKHEAVKMTLRNRGRYFEELDDEALISEIFSEYGLSLTSSFENSILREQVLQANQSDWDFCLSRVKNSGHLLFVKPDEIELKKPAVNDEVSLSLEYGASVLNADLQTDARIQTEKLEVLTWQSDQQNISAQTGSNTYGDSPGNTSVQSLSQAMGDYDFTILSEQLDDESAQQRGDAQLSYRAINRVTGSIKTIGVGDVHPGDILELVGFSDSLNGKAMLCGIRHEFDSISGWRSYFQLGGLEEPSAQPSNAAMGLYIGKVVDIMDPQQEFRVKVRLPLIDNDGGGIWARVSSIDAGPDRGLFIRPEIDDEVIVAFLQHDPKQALILGYLHSSAQSATESPEEGNNIKTWVSREGLVWRFDDNLVQISLETPQGNKVTISEDLSGIEVVDQNGNSYTMNDDGIEINSIKDLTLSAQQNVNISAGQKLDAEAGTSLNLNSNAGSTLESASITVVKGSLVQIN